MKYPTAFLVRILPAVALLAACAAPVLLSAPEPIGMTLPEGTVLTYVRASSPQDTLIHEIVALRPYDRQRVRLQPLWHIAEGGVTKAWRPRTTPAGPLVVIEARTAGRDPGLLFRLNTAVGLVRLTGPRDGSGDLLVPAPSARVARWGEGGRMWHIGQPDTVLTLPAGSFRCIEVVYADPLGQEIRSWWTDGVGWVASRGWRGQRYDLVREDWDLVRIRRPGIRPD